MRRMASLTYTSVRIKATVPLRKHLWDVGRFWPAWEESGDNSVRQLGQPRKCKKEVVRAIAEGRSALLNIAPVDLLAEYVLYDEYVPEKGATRREEHVLDESFRTITRGLLYKDAPTLLSTHPAAAERIDSHAERRTYLRSRCAHPSLDPLGLMSRVVVAGGSDILAAAAAARDAAAVSGARALGASNSGAGPGGLPPAEFVLCLAVGYDAASGCYTVWLAPKPTYATRTDAECAAAPSPLPPHECAVGTMVAVAATQVRAHDVRANLFRDYFKGQEVLARRVLDGELPGAEGSSEPLSERLMRRAWSLAWHAAEVVGSDKADLKVLLIRYASDGADAPPVAVPKCDITLRPEMGEPSKDELKALRRAHKRRLEGRPGADTPPPMPGLAAIQAAVAAGRPRASTLLSTAVSRPPSAAAPRNAAAAVQAAAPAAPESPAAATQPVALRHGPPTEAALAQLAAQRPADGSSTERAAKAGAAVAEAAAEAEKAEAAAAAEQEAEAEQAASRAAEAEAAADRAAAEEEMREWAEEKAAAEAAARAVEEEVAKAAAAAEEEEEAAERALAVAAAEEQARRREEEGEDPMPPPPSPPAAEVEVDLRRWRLAAGLPPQPPALGPPSCTTPTDAAGRALAFRGDGAAVTADDVEETAALAPLRPGAAAVRFGLKRRKLSAAARLVQPEADLLEVEPHPG